MSPTTRLAVLGCAVCVFGLLVYAPGVCGPLMLDDRPWLTANTLVKIDGRVADGWRAASLSYDSGPLGRPVAMLSFAADHAMAGGFSSCSLKFVNVVLHLVCALLIYPLFMAILTSLQLGPSLATRRLVALTAAAIWFLHPLNVSTVLYAIQRMAILSTLFVFAGLALYARCRLRWAETGAATGQVIALALWLIVLTLLAVLSKENGVLLIALLLVLEVCVFRGKWKGGFNRGIYVTACFALIVPAIAVLALLTAMPHALEIGFAGREFTLWERLMTQGRVLWIYLSWIVIPDINAMSFYHDDIVTSTGLLAPTTTLVALIAWPALLLLGWYLRSRFPLLFLATLFYLVGHSMESSFWPLEMAFEHRNYLPAIMVCLLVAYLFVSAAQRVPKLNMAYPITGLILVLSLLLFVRVQTWSDEVSLSHASVTQQPQSPRANHMYANALLRHANVQEGSALSAQERNESLLVSRHFFEKMYQADQGDVAALVMLMYLDATHFAQLQTYADWLPPLTASLQSRRLQPTDWNALELLFDLAGENEHILTAAELDDVLAILQDRYPRSAEILRYRYKVRAGREGSPDELLSLLQQAQVLAPNEEWVYRLTLGQQASVGDVEGMYETTRLWLLNDPKRYHVNELKSLFSLQEKELKTADE